MTRILLITIGFSLSLCAGFTRDNSTQIVTDTVSHLQWQDDEDAKNITKTWQEAIDYCEGISPGGYTDWRLPNINELKSIVDSSKTNPAVVTGFQNIYDIDNYWSSTTYEGFKDDAWIVNFNYGYVSSNGKDVTIHVRCVRDGQ